jgi:YHS domain-containing protein
MIDEFLSRASALCSQERAFAMAIVVRYHPPVSGKPGDKAIIDEDGRIWGWIGGGCVQTLVVQEALKAIEEGKSAARPHRANCGMVVDESRTTYVSNYHGQTYYFCCAACKQIFDKQPETYLTRTSTMGAKP